MKGGLLTYLRCSGLINKLLSSCYARARDADRDANRQIEMEIQIADRSKCSGANRIINLTI